MLGEGEHHGVKVGRCPSLGGMPAGTCDCGFQQPLRLHTGESYRVSRLSRDGRDLDFQSQHRCGDLVHWPSGKIRPCWTVIADKFAFRQKGDNMGAWVLILLIATESSSLKVSLSVTPIYFQTADACKLVAAQLTTSPPKDRGRGTQPVTQAKCYSTENGTKPAD